VRVTVLEVVEFIRSAVIEKISRDKQETNQS